MLSSQLCGQLVAVATVLGEPFMWWQLQALFKTVLPLRLASLSLAAWRNPAVETNN